MAGGSYRIRAFFGTNAVPDWVAEPVAVSVDTGQATATCGFPPREADCWKLPCRTGTIASPQSQAMSMSTEDGYQAAAASSSNGLALLRLPPGEYRISVTKQGARAENTSASVAAGQTNRVEIETGRAAKNHRHRPSS